MSAGFLLVRAFEGWCDRDQLENWGMDQLLARLETLNGTDPVTIAMRRLGQMLANPQATEADLADSMLQYARALEEVSAWALAADLYDTTLRSIRHRRRIEALCHVGIAHCYFRLNALPEAERAYERAALAASCAGDAASHLRARMGLTSVAIVRGNLRIARARAAKALRQARALGVPSLLARALHDCAQIYGLEGSYYKALRVAMAALARYETTSRDRIRCDVAYALYRLGMFEGSRYLYCAVARHATERVTRMAALVNLLDIAARQGDEAEFTRLRVEVEGRDMPPYLNAHARWTVAEGCLRLGMYEAGRESLKITIAMASEHGFNQLLIEAETLLRRLNRASPETQRTDPATTSDERSSDNSGAVVSDRRDPQTFSPYSRKSG
jgi:tetratricopeptide (TPR) repeat protein